MASDTEDLIEVRDSGIHGLGAFARRSVAAGTRIGVYGGRRYTSGESAERDWDNGLTYVFGFADGSLLDGSDGGNATRHLNHSCAPNCVAFEIEDEAGEPQIVIEARRRIRAGEELFIDYALDIGGDDPAAYLCRCGARNCRGTMAAA
ncbi:MAG: SET domain-containing protein-lysine N-methyltransferase [Burkholderiales bacterium]|nr:SET domain-containing protein-lysine N-methyltransferase [Burkholderiales bacterium]MDE2396876.1 SET domain-containing protein-lysine N-methyltransferase [Burkholderiales bacterium]MDE2452579.1 SET domain-containing protein-lysine N-methyltransferase [Burkholderiales bacterium]